MKYTAYFRIRDESLIDKSVGQYEVKFDAVDANILVDDVDEACQHILDSFIYRRVESGQYSEGQLPFKVTVETIVFGIRIKKESVLDKKYFDYIKDDSKPAPELNKDSLKNDIQQLVPMLQTFSFSFPKSANWDDLRYQVGEHLRWIHYILQKHFQIPVPPEYVPKTAEELFKENQEKAKSN